MKKLLLTIAFAITLMLPSVAEEWNFSDLTVTSISDTYDFNGFVIYPGSKTISIDESTATVEGVTYTKRLKSGGKSSTDQRVYRFEVPGNALIEFVLASGSSSDATREIIFKAGSTEVYRGYAPTSAGLMSFNYTGDATTIEISFGAAINMYMVRYTASSELPPYITTVTPEEDAEDVALNAAITFAYSKAVTTSPTVTVNGNAATLTTEDNINYTVSGVTLEYATTYEVAVSATDEGEVEAKSWSFTTMNNPAYAYIEPVPADGATEVALDATVQLNPSETLVNPVITVLEDGVAIESTYDAENDVVVFEKGYLKVYTITVTADNLDGATEWSFTTEEEVVCPVQLTTESIVWNIESIEGEVVADNTLYFSAATKRNDGVRMNRASGGVYMMFALPANVTGRLSFSAKSSGSGTRTVKYLLSDTFDKVPTESEGVEIGGVVEKTELSVEISTTAITYVFVYNNSGNTDYYDLAWTVVYDEPILSNDCYYLVPNEAWKASAGTYYAKFINKNDATYTWVQASASSTADLVEFYLAAGNLPQSAATRSGEGATYTHVVFFKSEVAYDALTDAAITGTYTEELVLNPGEVYTIGGSISTGIENAAVADGIRYACGVVEAEGDIEVYSINGAVVARGNDVVDLRGLATGVYVVRCGNQVRKVVR